MALIPNVTPPGPFDMSIAKFKSLAEANRDKAKDARIKGRAGKAAYHARRAQKFEGLAVENIVMREVG